MVYRLKESLIKMNDHSALTNEEVRASVQGIIDSFSLGLVPEDRTSIAPDLLAIPLSIIAEAMERNTLDVAPVPPIYIPRVLRDFVKRLELSQLRAAFVYMGNNPIYRIWIMGLYNDSNLVPTSALG
jgi:hypothetical protein